MDIKGLQNVRRDSSLLLRETLAQCLEVLLKEESAHVVLRCVLTLSSLSAMWKRRKKLCAAPCELC